MIRKLGDKSVELYKYTSTELGFDLYSKDRSDCVVDNHSISKSSIDKSSSLKGMDLFGGDSE